MSPITEIPAAEIGHEALKAVASILGGGQITSLTFTKRIEGSNEGILSECVRSEPIGENRHVVVSTYGTGGIPTNSKMDVTNENGDSKTYRYHSEFYMVAADRATAGLLAEELANLAFVINTTKTGFLPGIIIEGINHDSDYNYLFTTEPLGIHSKHHHDPIFTDKFAMNFTAVTKLYRSEVELIKEKGEAGKEEINQHLISLGSAAYLAKRAEYQPETV